MPAILQDWENFAATIYPDSAEADSVELRDHAEAMLKTIANDIDKPQAQLQSTKKSKGETDGAERDDTPAEIHAVTRLAAGFTIDQLMAEYRALRASVLRLRRFEKHADDQLELDTMIRFNEAIDQALSESVARYSLITRES